MKRKNDVFEIRINLKKKESIQVITKYLLKKYSKRKLESYYL